MTWPDTTLDGSARRLHAPEMLLRRFMRRYLKDILTGALTVTFPSGLTIRHQGIYPGPEAHLTVRRWRTLWRIMSAGALGFARAYMDDDFRTQDITALLDFATANEAALAGAASGSRLSHLRDRIRHWRRTNTRRGSKRNIAAHYDLGNEFYAPWLDAGMNYSSALYARADQTLEDAQNAKLSRILDLLDVAPNQRVLEIGFGWGALAERLVANGCRFTGLTLSKEQFAFTTARLADASGPQADLRLQDYRDVEGCYDRIASVEMLEAVGERYWPAFFDKLRQSLTDTGVAVLQVITIAEARFGDYRRRPDFIQRYVFPGGMLPTVEIIRKEAARAGLRVVAQQAFGESYAATLAVWRQRFLRNWPRIEALGFDLRFKRMWEYYLAYCEVGFRAGAIDVSLFKLVPAAAG